MFGLGWILGRGPPQPPPDEMEWDPTTPPAQPPIYYENYIPGGFPITPAAETTNAFARPASPYWIVSASKRVCKGIAETSKIAWNGSVTVGQYAGIGLQVAGEHTLRGTKAAANYAQSSTTSIIRRHRARKPRNNTSPRTIRANIMRENERLAQEQRERAAEELRKQLEYRHESCPTADMVWEPHFDEKGRFQPNPIFLGYRAPKESAIFPADDPERQLQQELVAAIPLSHRFIATPKRKITNKTVIIKGVKMPSTDSYKPRNDSLRCGRSHTAGRRFLTSKATRRGAYSNEMLSSPVGRIQTTGPNPDTPEATQTDTVAVNHSSSPTGQVHTTETVPNTPNATQNNTAAVNIPPSPTGQIEATEPDSDTQNATQDGTADMDAPLPPAGRDVDTQVIPNEPDPAETIPDELQNLHIEEPAPPPSPALSTYSDISSTCDIRTPPRMILPVADAVGSSSTPAPSQQVASKAPAQLFSLKVGARSPPGAWPEDEEATTEWDELADNNEDNSFTKTPARRNVSQLHRETQEELKNSIHGTTRKSVTVRIADRQAAAAAKRQQFNITPLSQDLDDRVETYLRTGITKPGIRAADISAADLQRCAKPRNHTGAHDNWLNDEVINNYLKMVADYGVNLTGRPQNKPPSHFAFNSFFYSKLADPKQGVKSISRWVSRARINGQRLLEVEQLYVPINSGLHWTLAVVSGTNKTITYYDSLGGHGQDKMKKLLAWVQVELGSAFLEKDWQMITGQSGRQANSDDCGVFTITNARQLALGMVPAQTFGPQLAAVQRRRIVAELAAGEFLVAGS